MINMNIALPQINNTVANSHNPCDYMIKYNSVGSEIAIIQPSLKHPTLDMCETTRKINRSRWIYSIRCALLPKTGNPDKSIVLKPKEYQHQGVPSQVSYIYSRGTINTCKAAPLKCISLKSKFTTRSANRHRVHSPAYGARCRQCSCGQSGGVSWQVRQWAASTGWSSHEAQLLPFAAPSPHGNLLGNELGKPSAARSLADTRLSISPAGVCPWALQGNLLESGTPFDERVTHEGQTQGNSYGSVVLGRGWLCKGLNKCKRTRKRQNGDKIALPPHLLEARPGVSNKAKWV